MNILHTVAQTGKLAFPPSSKPSSTQVITDVNALPFRITLTIQVNPVAPWPALPTNDEIVMENDLDTEAPAIDYSNRKGYDPKFLGLSKAVPLPKLSAILLRDVARLTNATGPNANELKYTHFSVVQNRQRKMPFLTAVNIDGRKLRRIPRGDNWIKDSRIDQNAQFGNELYANNDLDRGHMVRRLDPVWGADAEASLANDDTFHFTNSCPQHKDLNQKTWADLEDYILDNAGARSLKVSVFTGPVFRSDDKPYRTARIPREFWKLAVLVDDQTGNLSATAYLLSQAGMIEDLEFLFGPFRTYQISVAQLQTLTDLDFGNLADFDPLGTTESIVQRVIDRPQDIRFR